MTLWIDDPPWCFTPLYKRASLRYRAAIEVTGQDRKQIAFRGAVDAASLGLDSCGNVRRFLVSLATADITRQLASGLEQGPELMWKCGDGKLRLSGGDHPCNNSED